MIKYSIILRAYNAEEKVSRSIESIIHQSYKNWELLIVNDGSTDRTGEICEQYALEDDRIKVIYQENKGCLLATQTGVKYASGEYVCLVDSDDWYEKTYIEKVDAIVRTQKVDMVVAGYHIIGPNGDKTQFRLVEKDELTTAQKAIQIFLETTNYALWNKFIARERIQYTQEEQDYFDKSGKTTNFGDDLFLLMPVLCGCENVYFTSDCLYNYTIDNQSISHQKIINHWNELRLRIRLMEFTYYAIAQRQCMNEKIENLISLDTVVVIIDNVIDILKSRKIDKEAIYELNNNDFYKKNVMQTDFSVIRKKIGKKRAVTFKLFNILVQWLIVVIR